MRDMQGVRIEALTEAEVPALAALAREIWHLHYPGIIGIAQIDYMLAQRYDPDVLRAELRRAGLWWDVLRVDGTMAGFASYALVAVPREMKLDKLYVHPRHQRRGHGGRLIRRAADAARRHGCEALVLAVNKRNAAAIAAYRRHGFGIRSAAVVDIGGGFVMDDYVMEMQL